MELLTRALYLLSTGLLVPVIVLLLLLFARSLLVAGGAWGAWLSRLRFRSALQPLLDQLDHDNVEAVLRDADLPREPRWAPAVGRLLDHGRSAAQREKALADFEAGCETDLAAARTMARLGPMLGLMGTLIPMGPALVGLAAGDVAAMAQNLQVAFSTTVVGLFVGGVGFAVQQAKQRWHAEALNDLEFVSGLIGERAGAPADGPRAARAASPPAASIGEPAGTPPGGARPPGGAPPAAEHIGEPAGAPAEGGSNDPKKTAAPVRRGQP